MVSNDVYGDGVTVEAVSESSVYRPRMTLENINRDCLKNIGQLFLRLFNICGIAPVDINSAPTQAPSLLESCCCYIIFRWKDLCRALCRSFQKSADD